MPNCPMCTKPLAELTRRCPTCMADLDLLVDYVQHLGVGLEKAEQFTRAGELGQAMWAYLEVLEVDPDNGPARRQVGQVATAVRQFDRTAAGRRWLNRVRGINDDDESGLFGWLRTVFVLLAVLTAFALGYGWGTDWGERPGTGDTPPVKPAPPADHKKTLSGH